MTTLPPTWPGGPEICAVEHLPCCASPKALSDWHETNCPGVSVTEKWQCKHCGMWHAKGNMREPSGATSGTGTRSLTGILSREQIARQEKLSFKYEPAAKMPYAD